MIWKILQIEKTKDENIIRSAYRERLRSVNPEDDEKGFKELRRAYEEAIEYANQVEDEHTEDVNSFGMRKNEVDRWIDKIAANYEDVIKRCNEEKWKAFLSDPVCDDLDTELEAAEKLLVFFMSHNTMPRSIWTLVEQRFHYTDNFDRWKEKFPENYLRFIQWQIEKDGYMDFTLFGGKTDDHVDDFVTKIYQVVRGLNDDELDGIEQLLKELKRYEVTHPYMNMAEANYYLACAKKSEDADTLRKQALAIMEDLEFEYSDNNLIEQSYADALVANGQNEKARAIYEKICEEMPANINCRIGIARCDFFNGDLEVAKEKVEDVLDEDVQNQKCLDLLDEINDVLEQKYSKQLEEQKSVEIACKLGWCYYQKQEFKKGIELLDAYDGDESYDFVNLRCRLYLAEEQHDLAYPLVRKWKAMIEETVDDGSHEMKRRLNRITLAQFSLAVCIWEQEYHKKEESDQRQKAYEESIALISEAVKGESNQLIRLTYMDQMARFYLDAKKYEECVSVCTDILKEEPGFFPALVQRQKAHYEMRNAKGVIDDFFDCKEIYPGFIQPYLYAAEVFYDYSQLNDVRHVIEDAKGAGLESDTLALYSIYLLHYEDPTDANKKQALKEIEKLYDSVKEKYAKAKEEKLAIEDVTDLIDESLIAKECALLYWDLNRVGDALNVVNVCLEKMPENIELNMLKADLIAQSDRYDDIIALCEQLLEKHPDNITVLLKRARAYEWKRDYVTAVEQYEKILEKDSKCQTAVARLMYINEFFGDCGKGISYFKKAKKYATQYIDLNGSPEGYIERAAVCNKLYEFEEAIKDCKEAIDIDASGNFYYEYVHWGVALFRERKIDEAIEMFLKAISIDDKKGQTPYRRLAECYMIKKDYHKAIEMYETVMRIWEGEFGLCEEVANCYALLGEYKKACELYLSYPPACLKAYNEKKTDDSHHGRMVMCYCDCIRKCSENQDYKLGEKYIKKAMKELSKIKGQLMPNSIDVIIEFYRDQGDYKHAIAYAEKFLAFAKEHKVEDEDCKDILFAYATVLFECRKKEEAKAIVDRYFRVALEGKTEEELFEDKRYINMHAFNFAIMNLCIGKLSKAKEYLQKIPSCSLCSMCVTCDCFEYYFAMGLVAEIEKDYETAQKLYEKAIDIKGYYACAKYHLTKIRNKK